MLSNFLTLEKENIIIKVNTQIEKMRILYPNTKELPFVIYQVLMFMPLAKIFL